MPFRLGFSVEAQETPRSLEMDAKKLKKVRKCLALLASNPRPPGLHTHEFHSIRGENGEKAWEAYVENNTSAAWRVIWHYGPGREEITVVTITPHP